MTTTENTTKSGTIAAIRIDTAGNITRIRLEKAENGTTLQSLYRHTGARWVECFTARAGDKATHVDAWMDEEGRINGSTPNAYASAVIAHLFGELPVVTNDALQELAARIPGLIHFGNIVLTGFDAGSGDTADVPADVADIITAIGFTIN